PSNVGPRNDLFLFRFELKRAAVHAVAQARGLRSIGKDMPEMPAALGAMDFGPLHQMARIARGADRAFTRLEKARPAAGAFVFSAGVEKFLTASRAAEYAGALFRI